MDNCHEFSNAQESKSLASPLRKALHLPFTNHFPAAAFNNPAKNGRGRFGRDKNSGWNWLAL